MKLMICHNLHHNISERQLPGVNMVNGSGSCLPRNFVNRITAGRMREKARIINFHHHYLARAVHPNCYDIECLEKISANEREMTRMGNEIP